MNRDLEMVRCIVECDPSTVSVKDRVSWYIFDIVMMVIWSEPLCLSPFYDCLSYRATLTYFSYLFLSSQGGNLPIHHAVDNIHLEVVRVLLECDPSTVSVKNGVSCYIFDIVMMVMWWSCGVARLSFLPLFIFRVYSSALWLYWLMSICDTGQTGREWGSLSFSPVSLSAFFLTSLPLPIPPSLLPYSLSHLSLSLPPFHHPLCVTRRVISRSTSLYWKRLISVDPFCQCFLSSFCFSSFLPHQTPHPFILPLLPVV